MEVFEIKSFGLRIKELRKKINKTQQEIATDLGLTPGAISLYEKGETKISMEHLYSIAIKYSVNINWLLTGKGEMLAEQSHGENYEMQVQKESAVLPNDLQKELSHAIEKIKLQEELLEALRDNVKFYKEKANEQYLKEKKAG